MKVWLAVLSVRLVAFSKILFYGYYIRILLNAILIKVKLMRNCMLMWLYCFFCLSVNVSSIFASLNDILVLNGTNFEKWRDHVTIVLRFMDLDYVLKTDEPPAITDKSSIEEKTNYEKWERCNRMCLMVMKHSISIT